METPALCGHVGLFMMGNSHDFTRLNITQVVGRTRVEVVCWGGIITKLNEYSHSIRVPLKPIFKLFHPSTVLK